MIGVVGPELGAFAVEHLSMRGEHGQGEGVERDHALGVFGLAVRLDHLAVDHDPRHIECQLPGVQVEQLAASPRQFAAPHA